MTFGIAGANNNQLLAASPCLVGSAWFEIVTSSPAKNVLNR
jgi:hypothetical protein